MRACRIVIVLLCSAVSLTLGGCSVTSPGDPGVVGVDHGWLEQPKLFDRFDTDARDFHPVNAYLLALAARAGDMNTAEQRDTLRTWGFDRHTPVVDRTASVYAYVASNARMALVVFSGTDIRNIRDLESDADALYPVRRERYCDAADALLHRGFATNLDAIWGDITAETRDHAAGGKPVFVAGHSRGGAFAVLAASGWAQDGAVRVTGLYTFGQPRVGNVAFAKAFAAQDVPYFRVINERDAVAGIPIQIGNLGADYAHTGIVAHLASGPALRKDPSANSLRLISIDPDHYLDGYLRNLYLVVTNPARIEHPAWASTLVSAAGATTRPSTNTMAPATSSSLPALPRPPGA